MSDLYWAELGFTIFAILAFVLSDVLRWHEEVLPWRRLLLVVLVLDGTAFAFSAGDDMHSYPAAQALSSLLRFVVGFLNLAAAWLIVKTGPPRTVPGFRGSSIGSDPWALPIVPMAQAAAVPMLFMPVWIELRSPVRSEGEDIVLLAISASLLLYAVIGVLMGLTRGHIKFGWVAFGSLLPLAGVFQFWFLNFYKPLHDQPSLDVDVAIKKINYSRGITRLQGTVSLKNNGQATVDVVGAMYAITGNRFKSGTGMRPKDETAQLRAEGVSRKRYGVHVAVLRADQLAVAGNDVAPGQKRSETFVLDASDKDQDFVRLTVHLFALPHVGNFDPQNCEEKKNPLVVVCKQVRLPGESLVSEVLGDRPRARSLIIAPKGAVPYLDSYYLSEDHQSDGMPGGDDRNSLYDQRIASIVRDQATESTTEYRLDP
ncbi:hypothetical protein PGH47_18350 [Streptomyces sp. HUAS 31]|uniref:hypothetical protein n=1 Tax=Streptomyces sp. HUAS 31 TaxID=3020055 RepID=UPI0023055C72|nr:hypothetical protein [Streptomyces sp. HUAS 31]WCD97527.1 hypothetical protein PGH47_18350 [Streptomyces sp. HUAS 31]